MPQNAPQPDDPLALHGGTPAAPEGPPSWPLADESVHAAMEAAWADGSWGQYHGPHCDRLTERLAEMHQVEHALLCSSGTYAVEAALRGLGVGSGDEVVLAGYDFPGNFRAIEAVGARPVLVDLDPENWSLDPMTLESVTGERVRAVIASHLHGGLVFMRPLMELAKSRHWQVVEDACQAPGAMVDGRMAGTWGDVGVLSFGGSKLLTAGRGGAILTQRAEVLQRAKIHGHRGNDAFPLSEIQAAVLLPQLDLLAGRNEQRRKAVARLLQETAGLKMLRPVVNRVASDEPSYYKLAWRYEATADGGTREKMVAALQAEGIAIDTGFRGFADRGERRCRKNGTLEHSRAAAQKTLLLHHPVLLEDDRTLLRVARGLKKTGHAELSGELDAAGDSG